jgi:hypothetical protein
VQTACFLIALYLLSLPVPVPIPLAPDLNAIVSPPATIKTTGFSLTPTVLVIVPVDVVLLALLGPVVHTPQVP